VVVDENKRAHDEHDECSKHVVISIAIVNENGHEHADAVGCDLSVRDVIFNVYLFTNNNSSSFTIFFEDKIRINTCVDNKNEYCNASSVSNTHAKLGFNNVSDGDIDPVWFTFGY